MKPRVRTSGAYIRGKLLFLLAVTLMGVAVAQKPSMLLLCIAPKGLAATAVRLFMGLLTAMAVRACVPGMARRSHALLGGRWSTLVAFALMLVLLGFVYGMVGNRSFSALRLSDLIMYRAYVTQSVAFSGAVACHTEIAADLIHMNHKMKGTTS